MTASESAEQNKKFNDLTRFIILFFMFADHAHKKCIFSGHSTFKSSTQYTEYSTFMRWMSSIFAAKLWENINQ